jgi:hypothetical protein
MTAPRRWPWVVGVSVMLGVGPTARAQSAPEPVSDREHFAQSGGIAGLFVEQGRMRFAINVEAAQRCRLRISSRLLSLAKIVKDGMQ